MRITFYLGRQVLIAMGLVVVALTCIIWLSQSLRFIELIVNRGLPLWTFLQLTVLLLPAWLTLVLPIACFAAVLFVYNRLTSDRELMVMAAAGLGPAKLARPALLVGVLTVVAGYCMTIYLQPLGYRTFKEMQFSIRHNHANTLLREGVFTTVARDVTFFVRQRRGAGELEGILVHDARDPAQTVTVIAQRGTLVMADGGLRVVMENGNRQTRDRDDGRLNLLYFDRYAVDLSSNPNQRKRTSRDRNEMFVGELFDAVPGAAEDDRHVLENRAEGHRRLVSPLLGLTLVMIALAAMFQGDFSRQGQGRRILAAVLAAGVVQGAFLGARYVAGRHAGFDLLIYLVPVLPVALILLAAALPRRRATLPGAA